MTKLYLDEWVTIKEAAQILSKNNGRKVSENYVRVLKTNGYVRTRELDGRTKLYFKKDIEEYRVRKRSPKGEGKYSRQPKTTEQAESATPT